MLREGAGEAMGAELVCLGARLALVYMAAGGPEEVVVFKRSMKK